MQSKSSSLPPSARADVAGRDDRFPLGVCWLIWIAASFGLWSLLFRFVA